MRRMDVIVKTVGLMERDSTVIRELGLDPKAIN